MIRFLPSYVGSKKHWVGDLEKVFCNKPIIEYFCGSAVISANLASNAILNDLDEKVATVLRRFDEQIVPDEFTEEDYYRVRSDPNWWKYLFCLQRMSFSGVFRYSKNGYNVPIKKGIGSIFVREEYEKALIRWEELNPVILNSSYDNFSPFLAKDRIAVVDPPYEGSKAAYNSVFNYEVYWRWVENLKNYADTIILFDKLSNLNSKNIDHVGTRNMRVTGHYAGDIEAIAVFTSGKLITSWDNTEKTEKQKLKVIETTKIFNTKVKHNECSKCNEEFKFVYRGGRPKTICDRCK